jgi:acetate kinase
VRVLVLNPGSSSLKASVIEPPERTLARHDTDWGSDATAAADRLGGLRAALAALKVERTAVDAVGYRVVHGGPQLTGATLIDDAVAGEIARLDELAPLHNRVAHETIAAGRRLLPDVPHVACFDTAFHATLPVEASTYPVPAEWRERWGIRRYGFHGLSVAWAVRRAAAVLERDGDELRLVVAHLGSGCSVTAVRDGASVDTSMGFTPLEGLMMGTRSGSLDPGILLHLLGGGHLDVDGLTDALEHRSGLLGVSGRTASARDLEAAASSGDGDAELALRLFARRAAGGIAAAASTLDRLDALVFTGGIGENSHRLRADIAARLAVLGVAPVREPDRDGDALLSEAGGIPVLRVAAREDLEIAVEAARLLERADGVPDE